MRKLFIVSTLVIISTIITSVFVIMSVKSPVYTLKAIASSIEVHNWKKFSKYVDINSVLNSFFSKNIEESNTLLETARNLALKNLKETIINNLKSKIEQTDKEDSFNLFYFKKNNSLVSKIKSKNEGSIINSTIPVKTEHLDIYVPVKLTFRKKLFQLVLIAIDVKEINNINSTIKKLTTEYYNLPIKDSLNSLVKITVLKKYKGCANSYYNTCFEDLLVIKRKIQNLSSVNIVSLRYAILPSKSYNTNWQGVKYDRAENIKPKKSIIVGSSEGWKYNQFIPSDVAFMKAKKKDISFIVTEISYMHKFGQFEMTIPLKEKEYKYIKDDIKKDNLTLDKIIKRRKKYNVEQGYVIKTLLNYKGN